MITEAARIFMDDDRSAAARSSTRPAASRNPATGRSTRSSATRRRSRRRRATVLTYRHVSRIVANLLNIVSAVVMPLDRLDYPGEEESSEG